MCIYIYIYIHIYVCIYIYIYTYILYLTTAGSPRRPVNSIIISQHNNIVT